ncbi:nucleoside deaminase [Chthonobacter albigriseus]|uniref:nucleoside deaminase n=1 Tax=Chthonobacter albigriseus TaxID=1683161 RepID=UPI0015EEF88F|nr:nucleoside deaminase [Chthonobacter albigriseus]
MAEADKLKFMRRAIEISRDEMRASKAAPFGCVIVKDGEIVGEGVNRVVENHDPTSHGEVEAIRDAGRKLGTWDLSGCELYTSCQPCELCVAAMFWARITKMYYASTLKDAEEVCGFDLEPLTTLVRHDVHDRALLKAEPMLREEALVVLREWAQSPEFTAF